ncbi:MAG: hypothetical protein ABIL11_10520 [Chloroflexota bacterium]
METVDRGRRWIGCSPGRPWVYSSPKEELRADETIRAEFEALLSPAIYAQAAYYRSLGLRERIPNLPLMIAAILALLWRQIP